MCGITYLLPSEDMQQSFRTYFKDGIVSLLVSTNLHPCNSEFEVLIKSCHYCTRYHRNAVMEY